MDLAGEATSMPIEMKRVCDQAAETDGYRAGRLGLARSKSTSDADGTGELEAGCEAGTRSGGGGGTGEAS
jgi:hypothetical protein